jgi:hypothetical protein
MVHEMSQFVQVPNIGPYRCVIAILDGFDGGLGRPVGAETKPSSYSYACHQRCGWQLYSVWYWTLLDQSEKAIYLDFIKQQAAGRFAVRTPY